MSPPAGGELIPAPEAVTDAAVELNSFLGVMLSMPISLNICRAVRAAWSCDASVDTPAPWQTWGGLVLKDTSDKNSTWFP